MSEGARRRGRDDLEIGGAVAQRAAGAEGKTLFELRRSDHPTEVLLGNVVNALKRPGRYLETSRPASVLAMFLLGAWVGRRLMPEPGQHERTRRR